MDIIIYVKHNFMRVYFSPSFHQMVAHSWEIFHEIKGNPVSKLSEQDSEAWNKLIHAWGSGKSSHSCQYCLKDKCYVLLIMLLHYRV